MASLRPKLTKPISCGYTAAHQKITSGDEPCAAEDFCGGIRIFLAQISQQHMLARAHPPRNRLADRTRSNHYDNIGHS